MKIGFNGYFLTKPFTGIGQYSKNILLNLSKLYPEDSFVVSLIDPLPEDLIFEYPTNVSFQLLEPKFTSIASISKLYWEQFQQVKFFEEQGVEWAFYPYLSNPWRNVNFKCLTTIHDTIPWQDKSYQQSFRSKVLHYFNAKFANKSDKILTVSNTSKESLVKDLKIPAEKITVIYNGVGPEFAENYSQEQNSSVISRFSVAPSKFFLYCGGYDKRKNVGLLIQAYEKYQKSVDNPLPLLLVGKALFDNKLYSKIPDDNPQIRSTGVLSSEDLAILYRQSRAFLNFSSNEGFNIPLMEAIFSGTEIVLSDIPVHHEVSEGYPLRNFIDPKNIEKNAEIFKKLAESEPQKVSTDIIQDFTKKFSWQKAAEIIRLLHVK